MKTIQMQRDGKTADVHPDEVDHMKAHGWVIVSPKKAAKK